jgi:hypothetical protein
MRPLTPIVYSYFFLFTASSSLLQFVITIIATTLVIVLDEFAFQIRNTNIAAGIAGLTFVVGLLMSFRITDAYKWVLCSVTVQ